MSSPALTDARASYVESLELAGRPPGTLALYDRVLRDFEEWLSDNGKPLAGLGS